MNTRFPGNLYVCCRNVLIKWTLNSFLVLFISVFLVNQAFALKIIPYFTSGNGNGTAALTGPKPPLTSDPSPYAVDCSKMIYPYTVEKWQTDYPSVPPQTIAICNAIKQWETLIKDPVTLKIEFIARTDNTGTNIGICNQFVAYIFPGKSEGAITTNSSNTQVLPYVAMKGLISKDDNADGNIYDLINKLPSANQFTSQNVGNTNFVPLGVFASIAQLRALGVDFPREILPPVGRGMLPGMDASVAFSSGFTYDYNQSNNIGTGPKTAAQWEAINLASIPRIVDFTGATAHEIGHALGFVSTVDSLPNVNNPFVSLLDLFRMRESDLTSFEKLGDFRDGLRNLLPQGDCGSATPQSPCQITATDVTKGNHVFVYAIVNGKAKYVPLSSGTRGDGFQASHLREPGNFVSINGGLYIRFVDPLFLAKNGPAGFLMEPGGTTFMHEVIRITEDDLRVLDILGWSVDYGQLGTVNSNPTSLSSKAATTDQYSTTFQNFMSTNGLGYELIDQAIEN